MCINNVVIFFDFIRSRCRGAERNSSRGDRYLTCTYASNCSYLALFCSFWPHAFPYLWRICLDAAFCRLPSASSFFFN